jgi:hypothetical protein
MIKTISVNGADADYVDLDEVLYGMMNEFKN